MNIEEVRTYCLSKNRVTEDFPFDQNTLAFKVCGKIFCLTDVEELPLKINLKCDPDYAIELREQFAAIMPGYHMNKKHWNTICVTDIANSTFVKSLIDHSYDLVVSGLTKKLRDQLK